MDLRSRNEESGGGNVSNKSQFLKFIKCFWMEDVTENVARTRYMRKVCKLFTLVTLNIANI